MFEIYKNFVPQVVNSMRMGMAGAMGNSSFYRPPSFYPPKQNDFFSRDFSRGGFFDSPSMGQNFPMQSKSMFSDFSRMGPQQNQFGNYDRMPPNDDYRGFKGNSGFPQHQFQDDYEQKPIYSQKSLRPETGLDYRGGGERDSFNFYNPDYSS